MGSKPAWQSVTLWVNLAMAALAFFLKPDLEPEYMAMIVAAVNSGVRYFLTEKPLSGLL